MFLGILVDAGESAVSAQYLMTTPSLIGGTINIIFKITLIGFIGNHCYQIQQIDKLFELYL
jgi:hypothetical protein